MKSTKTMCREMSATAGLSETKVAKVVTALLAKCNEVSEPEAAVDTIKEIAILTGTTESQVTMILLSLVMEMESRKAEQTKLVSSTRRCKRKREEG